MAETVIYKNFGFKVVFDLPTPRAHLIILRENDDLNYNTNPLDSILKMADFVSNFVRLCIEMKNNNMFSDSEMKLTLHTGNYSNASQFHAHWCINTDTYVKLYNQKQKNTNFRPTRQWIIKPNQQISFHEAYIQNVKLYDQKNSEKYFQKYKPSDLKEVNENCAADKVDIKNPNVSISYHEIHPKIEFKVKVDIGNEFEAFSHLLKAMTEFGIIRNYFSDTKGSHINIFMNRGIQTLVTGYIFVPPQEYYQLLPEAQRRQWLDEFKKDTAFYPD